MQTTTQNYYHDEVMKKSEIIFGILRIPIDFFMVIFAFLVAYKLRTYQEILPGVILPVDLLNFPPLLEYMTFAAEAAFVLVIIFALNNMYSMRVTSKISKEVLRAIFLVSAWLMVLIAYFFLSREFFFSRLVLGYGWIFSMLLVSFGRIGIRTIQNLFATAGFGQRRVLFLALNEATLDILDNFRRDQHYKIIGYLKRSKDKEIDECKLLGTVGDLEKIVKKYKVEEIVQTQYQLESKEAPEIVDFCRTNHLRYHFIPDLVQLHQKNIDTNTIAGVPLITLRPTPLEGWGKVWKRVFDLIGASIGLILLSPFFLVIPILIKLDGTKGTVLFKYLDDGKRAKRVGQYGKFFNFYKFRTMKP